MCKSTFSLNFHSFLLSFFYLANILFSSISFSAILSRFVYLSLCQPYTHLIYIVQPTSLLFCVLSILLSFFLSFCEHKFYKYVRLHIRLVWSASDPLPFLYLRAHCLVCLSNVLCSLSFAVCPFFFFLFKEHNLVQVYVSVSYVLCCVYLNLRLILGSTFCQVCLSIVLYSLSLALCHSVIPRTHQHTFFPPSTDVTK